MAGFSTNDALVFEKTVDTYGKKFHNEDWVNIYELKKCSTWIVDNKYAKVCLQFPDNLLCDSSRITSYLNSTTSATLYILADTSYGSCCVDCIAASHVDADSLIHFGPACLSPQNNLPVLYIYDVGILDIAKFVKTLAEVVSADGSVIIFYDTSFHRFHTELQDVFSVTDQVVLSTIEENACDDGKYQTICGRTFKKPLGKAQGVYIGTDSMTLTNLVLRMPDMNWLTYNEGELNSYNFQTSKFLMKRLHLVEKVKDASVVGVLVATLAVQSYLTAVQRIKSLCRASGKKCYTLAVGRPNVAKLANFPEIDVFVVVSCTENCLLLDSTGYFKPLVTLFEVDLALGGRPWNPTFSLDFRQLLPGGDMHVADCSNPNLEEGDVSLVTGKLRHVAVAESSTPDDTSTEAISLRDAGTVIESKAAEFLSQRSWGGLEQKIGETPVEKVQQGRSGIPMSYKNEGLQ